MGDEAVPFPKLEAKDLNAWFIQRRGGSNGNDDQIPYGSKSLKGGKKSNGSNDQKVDMLVRCQPCQRIFASMEAMRAHQKVGPCYIGVNIWSYLKFLNLEIYFP